MLGEDGIAMIEVIQYTIRDDEDVDVVFLRIGSPRLDCAPVLVMGVRE